MIDNTSPTTPEEAFKARQAALNASRSDRRAQLSPEEAARLAIIEDASGQLERAGIPFLLFADSTTPEESLTRTCWWQFNKMGYEADWSIMVQNAQPRVQHLLTTSMRHLSRAIKGALVWFDENKRALGGANEGEWTWCSKPGDEA